MTSVVSRRNVIGSLAATSAMPLWPLFALAASTTSHSFKFGAFEISVVSDGHMTTRRQWRSPNMSCPVLVRGRGDRTEKCCAASRAPP